MIKGFPLKSRIWYADLGRLVHVQFIGSGCFYGTGPTLTAEFMRKLPSAVRTALYLLTVQQGFKSPGHGFKRDSQTLVSWSWKNLFSLTYLRGLKFKSKIFWESKCKNEMWALSQKISEGLKVAWKTKKAQSVSKLAEIHKDQTQKSRIEMWSRSTELRIRDLEP